MGDYFCLSDCDVIGFDLDHTLCRYHLKETSRVSGLNRRTVEPPGGGVCVCNIYACCISGSLHHDQYPVCIEADRVVSANVEAAPSSQRNVEQQNSQSAVFCASQRFHTPRNLRHKHRHLQLRRGMKRLDSGKVSETEDGLVARTRERETRRWF
uniref:5'-nucleotidase domain-containing protein 1 n=1 Tax=Knipowitschia caucasica TaxID=637954 RepID=A0AAV2KAX0_KNICA